MRLNVFLNAFGKKEFVGILADEKNRIFFEYAPEFIAQNKEISPFKLPLKTGVFESDYRLFNGLFGLFNDSLPDGWGCLLLDRKLQKKGLSYSAIRPLDRLALIGQNPMGALEYEPAETTENEDFHIELDSLADKADRILNGSNDDILDELIKLNGSSGGARPKILAFVSDDKKQIVQNSMKTINGFSDWLIKFSNKSDRKDIGLEEYVYSIMAKNAGIDMPETYLFPSKTSSGHFGVKRFDRFKGEKRHIHTACGLLHADFRTSSIDYTSLLKLTLVLTKDIREVEKMVRLMIFNVKSGNKDDHSKNFSFMIDEKGNWITTPAYDLTKSDGINGEQTSMVNSKGVNITNNDFIKVAQQFDISEKSVKEMIEAVDDSISQYPNLLKQHR